MSANETETGHLQAHRLLDIVSRLREVRRRFVSNAGDGERFDMTEERLDAIILDLNGWLKPGGKPVGIGELDLRLAAVEEMIEAVGFPAYAHVIANVRTSLTALAEETDPEWEPPPPKRFEPPPSAGPDRHGPSDGESLEGAAMKADGTGRRGGWWLWLTVVGGCAVAALVVDLVIPRGPDRSDPDSTGPIAVDEPVVSESTLAPAPEPARDEPVAVEPFVRAEEARTRLVDRIGGAEEALRDGDLETALRHFAAAAAIDRHHRQVISMGKKLIDALLEGADEAFDDGEWERADARVADARHLAQGLYLETTKIDQTARKHAAMTRFEDVPPGDGDALRAAVGHSVRVTLVDREVLFGRLEAFEDDRLRLAIHSGITGGEAQFWTVIALERVHVLRVYDAERPSETILEP